MSSAFSTLAAQSSNEGFGTYAGTFLVFALIAATVVIMRMMSRSLRRMRANVEQHPENFGKSDPDSTTPSE